MLSETLKPRQYNDFIDLVKCSYVVRVFYNTVLQNSFLVC